MADMPDLSHLTPEERAIIENVMLRQKQEEETERELMKWVLTFFLWCMEIFVLNAHIIIIFMFFSAKTRVIIFFSGDFWSVLWILLVILDC